MPQLLPCIVQQCAGTPAAGWNRRIGSEGIEAHRGCQDMEERVEAIRDVGERTSTLRLCTLAETPPTGHGRCARRQHLSRLQKKEQEDGKQRGGSAPGTTRADGTLRRGV